MRVREPHDGWATMVDRSSPSCSQRWLAPHAARRRRFKVPMFQVDAAWPTIPNNWVLGEVTSIAVDREDHIWVLHVPQSIPEAQRANAAPPVLAVRRPASCWRAGAAPAEGYEWPEREHGIFVDAKDFVWISGHGGWPKPTGEGSSDDMILKFTTAGKLVMQIGRRGQSKGNTDTANVQQARGCLRGHPRQRGLRGRRLRRASASWCSTPNTGKFKRMWGAFGNPPPDDVRAESPASPTAARRRRPAGVRPGARGQGLGDGIVYVADRTNNRIQVFTTDGKYLRQVRLAGSNNVTPVPAGFAFSPDRKQQYLYVVDSGPMQIVIFDREKLVEIGRVGVRGPKPGEFDIIHHMATDSKGNLYGAEIVTNRRAQRFVLQK